MKRRVLSVILLAALILSAFVPGAMAAQGVVQTQEDAGVQPLGLPELVWSCNLGGTVTVAPGTTQVDIRLNITGIEGMEKQFSQFYLEAISADPAALLSFPGGGPPQYPRMAILGPAHRYPWTDTAPMQFGAVPRPDPLVDRTVVQWNHGVLRSVIPTEGAYITVRVLIPNNVPDGIIGTLTIRAMPTHQNVMYRNTPVTFAGTTTTIIVEESAPHHTVTLNAGEHGVWPESVTADGWFRTADGARIHRRVATDTPWANVTFPEPTAVSAFDFNGWSPVQPAGEVNASFEATAQWDAQQVSHMLTLHAGENGTWGTTPPSGWEFVSGSTTAIYLEVANNTAWPTFPTPSPNSGWDMRPMPNTWSPAQPAGANVIAPFEATAQQQISRTIRLNAGENGTWEGVANLSDWTVAADYSYIYRVAADGTPWNLIWFPTPTAVATLHHTGWTPSRPSGWSNITADFESTAQWAQQQMSRTIRLNAGSNGTWEGVTTGLDGWTVAADYSYIYREVASNAVWNTIPEFPTPISNTGWYLRPVPYTWSAARPADGNMVTTDFTATARWEQNPTERPEFMWSSADAIIVAPGTTSVDLRVEHAGPTGERKQWSEFYLEAISADPDALLSFPAAGGAPLHPRAAILGPADRYPWTDTAPMQFGVVPRLSPLVDRTVAQWNHGAFGAPIGCADIGFITARVNIPADAPTGIAGEFVLRSPSHFDNRMLPNIRMEVISTTTLIIVEESTPHHTITLHAGEHGIWPESVTADGWFRTVDGTSIHRRAEAGTAWDEIAFPTPAQAGIYSLADWNPVRPAGENVTADFASTAQWTMPGIGDPDPGGPDHDDPGIGGPPPDNGNGLPVTGELRAFLVGFPDGTIRPEAPLTRAEAVTIFFRLLDDEFRASEEVWSTGNGFEDVGSEEWFNNAISTMANLGVVRGETSEIFAPERSVTHGEFFAMLVRLRDMIEDETVSVNNAGEHWAEVYARTLEEANLISDFSGDPERLEEPITRAFVAELVNRSVTGRAVYDRGDMINLAMLRRTWTDLPASSPYYLHMTLAGHTVEYEVLDIVTAGDWSAIRWTRINQNVDWTVLERPGATGREIFQ